MSFLTPQEKRRLFYAGGAVILGGALAYGVHHVIEVRKANKAEGKALVDGTPENLAKRLQQAFVNNGLWGTDVETVRKVFKEIPYRDYYKEVETQYENLTKQGKSALNKDLYDELTTTEYYEMQAILNAKPVKKGQKAVFDWQTAYSYSHRLKAGFDYTIMAMPATDKEAVRVALNEIPTLTAFAMVMVAFEKEYGVKLTDTLDDELDFTDYSWKEIVYKKPKK